MSKEKEQPVHAKSPFVQGILLPQRVVMQIADEVAKRLKPKKKKNKKIPKLNSPFFIDTSAILDGRLFDLVRLGLFAGSLVVPDAVLLEIKNIADSADPVRKEKGRNALLLLEALKKSKGTKLVVLTDDLAKPVDEKLITLAKRYKGQVITCDFSLAKKAQIQGVSAINIHELANALKTTAVPGETFTLKLVHKGRGEDQAVGYLNDGTMVVVEKASSYLGKTVKVVILRIIQKDTGKILFAKISPETN
jgi:uncharacterized protein YacL